MTNSDWLKEFSPSSPTLCNTASILGDCDVKICLNYGVLGNIQFSRGGSRLLEIKEGRNECGKKTNAHVRKFLRGHKA